MVDVLGRAAVEAVESSPVAVHPVHLFGPGLGPGVAGEVAQRRQVEVPGVAPAEGRRALGERVDDCGTIRETVSGEVNQNWLVGHL